MPCGCVVKTGVTGALLTVTLNEPDATLPFVSVARTVSTAVPPVAPVTVRVEPETLPFATVGAELVTLKVSTALPVAAG